MKDSALIRVLTVDDHELLRRGIHYSLLSFDGMELVGEAASGEDALKMCVELSPDVVLMDIYLTGEMDGIKATQVIRNRFPEIQVVVLSSFFDRKLVQSAMQAGAIGYLVKGVSGEELAEVIRTAHAGRTTLDSEALNAILQEAGSEIGPGHDLTNREREALGFLVQGLSNAEIAVQMHITVAGVKYHVSNILSKFGATNRTEAAVLARQHGLVSNSD